MANIFITIVWLLAWFFINLIIIGGSISFVYKVKFSFLRALLVLITIIIMTLILYLVLGGFLGILDILNLTWGFEGPPLPTD